MSETKVTIPKFAAEPKFRAWLKSAEEMVEVLEIDFYNKEVAYIWTEQVSDYELEQTREVDKIDDLDLMQSTDLKDKNDVEIYERDFVKVTQYFGGAAYGELIHLVEKSEYNNNLMLIRQSKQRFVPEVMLNFSRSEDYEVIGNVWESPELLEVAE